MVSKGRAWGQRKVKDREAELAIRLYSSGKFSQKSIGKIIGIDQTVVSSIVLRKTDYSKRISPS